MSRRFIGGLSLALALLALFAGAAFAQGTGTKQIGLVIGLPDNKVYSEIVTVPADATAFDALKKANIKMVSATTSFGPAVCSINGVGAASADNCFADKAHFWAYYHLDATSKKWVVSQDGVGTSKPADGAVEGFVWSGMDASFNPTEQPPVLTFDQIKTQAGASAPAAAAATPAKATSAAPGTLPTTGGETLPLWPLAAAGLLFVAAGAVALRKTA
jgi:hypothetical protein